MVATWCTNFHMSVPTLVVISLHLLRYCEKDCDAEALIE